MIEEFTFHHLGILTPSLAESVERYVTTFHYTKKSPLLEIPKSAISVCCLERSDAPRIELIQPHDPESPLSKRTASGGYHLAWSVPDIEVAIPRLEVEGYHAMSIFNSSLWEGARCVFLVSPQQELVELVENPVS